MSIEEILLKTHINATARILCHDENGLKTYTYEVVVGFLPIDDVVSYESKKYSNIEECLSFMLIYFGERVKKLIKDYEP